MKVRLLTLTALAAFIFSAASCSTAPDTTGSGGVEVEEEDFFARPYFDKPVRRPLGLVRVSWNRIDGATGYQLQVSSDRNFSEIESKWTVSGTSMEIPLETGRIIWARVRAFDGSTFSSWSPELEIREEKL